MRLLRPSMAIILALVGATVLLIVLGASSHAAVQPGDTVVPLGTTQADVRTAYRDVLSHLYGGGRVHWAASVVVSPAIQPGDLVIPGGLATTADHADITATLPLSRAYGLRPGGVAVLRSTVVVTHGQSQMVAMWELAEVRQLLDGYLFGSLPYAVLDEAAIASDGLAGMDLLIVPTIRPDAVLSVTEALSASGALAAIADFVRAGGTLYAQSNGAYVAEAAGLLPPGTVDLDTIVTLDTGSELNQGQMQVQMVDSPLAWSWLTDTLYVLTDPVLHPSSGMDVVATLSNAGDVPAIVRAEAGEGQVILVAGHPTDEARRLGVSVFMDAVLLALSSRAELTGDAIQTWNPAYDPYEFPAYETVPVSATLTASNLWDTIMANVVVTETVSSGYVVSETSVFPAPAAVYTVTSPTTQTIIVWALGELAPGAEVHLGYWAQSDPLALVEGRGTFGRGVMRYDDAELGPTEVVHRPFVLTAQMAARLVGDRDLEPDRHYRIPDTGLYLDVALPLENKEWTLAPTVVVTDWVYLIYPIVDYENQHVILNANDGETIWMRNEPFLWGSQYPSPTIATAPTQTFTLDDWQGDWCVFTSTYGIHIDPPPALRPQTEDYGSFVTIPPSYTQYITVTAGHELLLPCLPLVFDLGPWPGYWYEEPAVRYGVHSRELFSRTVVFHGTPRENTVVMPHDAGSIYVAAGSDPVPFREFLTAATPYAATAPSLSGVTYQDVWSRTHFMPFRATFYDTWDWDSCTTCSGDWRERHAAINLTFGMLADLDGDGTPETPVQAIPTRLAETWVTWMIKSYNMAVWTIPSDMNLIEFPIFNGLGIRIDPRGDDWFDSFVSLSGNTTLVAVTPTLAYDYLYMQQNVPPGAAEICYISGTIRTYGGNHEGMFKLHDGARLIYRQMAAGPNRYEIYDSHVHSVMGYSSDGRVAGWVGPTAVSVYGDRIYYVYAVRDHYDPRVFDLDPYMDSWGYGDFVATSYAGGREAKTLFHSIVAPGDRTRARISLDNNTGVTLTDVLVAVETPAWITVTQLYTDPNAATTPEPIWPELAFLSVDTIPDAWRGVYYFDLQISDVPTALLGTVITLPVHIRADGLPADYVAPPLVLGLPGADGSAPRETLGPAHDLTLTDTLPSSVNLLTATLISQAQYGALSLATDNDATHLLSETVTLVFETFTPTIPFSVTDGVVAFSLPQDRRTLPQDEPLYVAASAAITRANHGPNQVSDGGTICYTDSFGMRWCDQGAPLTVEASGAVVAVDYFCEGGSAGVQADGGGQCTIPPGETSEITVRLTAYNAGDALARNVTATLTLPTGVAPVGSPLLLALGDVAPGGWASTRVTLQVTPESAGIAEEPDGWRFVVVNNTWGQFEDTFSSRVVAGQLGDAFAVRVLWKPRFAYLPLCMHNWDARPDLVVTSVVVDPADPGDFRVTIANLGHTTARDFWIDGYFDPASPPEVNQAWPDLCEIYGTAWRVADLPPGESLILTVGDAYYDSVYSRWPTAYPAGDHAIWVYVDAWAPPQPYGAVDEADEGNNRYGPVDFTVPVAPHLRPQ